MHPKITNTKTFLFSFNYYFRSIIYYNNTKMRTQKQRELRVEIDRKTLAEIKKRCKRYQGAFTLSQQSGVSYYSLMQAKQTKKATTTIIEQLTKSL